MKLNSCIFNELPIQFCRLRLCDFKLQVIALSLQSWVKYLRRSRTQVESGCLWKADCYFRNFCFEWLAGNLAPIRCFRSFLEIFQLCNVCICSTGDQVNHGWVLVSFKLCFSYDKVAVDCCCNKGKLPKYFDNDHDHTGVLLLLIT